jgi:hypothetical protein
MPSRKKIDIQKVLASLNVTCPKCGRGSQVYEMPVSSINFSTNMFGSKLHIESPGTL